MRMDAALCGISVESVDGLFSYIFVTDLQTYKMEPLIGLFISLLSKTVLLTDRGSSNPVPSYWASSFRGETHCPSPPVCRPLSSSLLAGPRRREAPCSLLPTQTQGGFLLHWSWDEEEEEENWQCEVRVAASWSQLGCQGAWWAACGWRFLLLDSFI